MTDMEIRHHTLHVASAVDAECFNQSTHLMKEPGIVRLGKLSGESEFHLSFFVPFVINLC